MVAPALSQSGVQTALRSFLLSILPAGTLVFEGQDNRVSEPSATNFVIMTVILAERLSTNYVALADCIFTGQVDGTTLTLSGNSTPVQVGSTLFGIGVASGTTIVRQIDGPPGGGGDYQVSIGQSVLLSRLACGNVTLLQAQKLTFQLDIHSDKVATAADMATTISTMFRDSVAVDAFTALGYPVTPLYADDPRQVPFLNSEQQFEQRWIVDAVLEAKSQITWPMQFADGATVNFVLIT